MTGRLQDKVAVITGGCSGIGLGTVELFVAEGACVVVADILAQHGAELEKRFPGSLRFIHCDVMREDDVAAAIAFAVREFGGLDVTFNNAGAPGTLDSIENMQAEQWDRTMNLLLRSVMFGIKHSIAPMRARGGGSIINTASISGATTSGTPAYCVAKAGVLHLTRMAALELAPHRIRVNSILPGIIPTAIFGNVLGMRQDQAERLVESLGDGTTACQPLPRPGNTRDIAEACLYFASDAAAFTTGTELRVDGGLTIMPVMEMNAEKPGSFGHLLVDTAQAMAEPD